MSEDLTANIKASRVRLARSRGALSGVLLIIGGVWAALVPFVGPYWNLAYTPSPDSTWKWTAARGWLEVLPGAVTALGGLLLLMSTNRLVAILGGWIAALAGAWLVIGPALADPIGLTLGIPDPKQSSSINAAEALSFFFAIGAAIVLVAGLALGRLSVHSVRDVRAAERRAAAEAEEQRLAAERAETEQRAIAEQQRAEHKRELDERYAAERARIAEEHHGRHDGEAADRSVDLSQQPPTGPGEPLPVQDGRPAGNRPPDNPPPFYGSSGPTQQEHAAHRAE